MFNSTKHFLNEFLFNNVKHKPTSEYTTTQENISGIIGFKSILRVTGFGHVTVGYASTKREAEHKAAGAFINCLVDDGMVPVEKERQLFADLQKLQLIKIESKSSGLDQQSNKPVKKSEAHLTGSDLHATQIMNALTQSDLVDLRAEIHGGWTVQNSKYALNVFLLKSNSPPVEYKPTAKETNLTGEWFTTLSCYIRPLRKKLHAEGRDPIKKTSEALCAMSIVRQLFHLGLIGAANDRKQPTRNKGKKIPTIYVDVPRGLHTRIVNYLSRMGVTPAEVDYERVSYIPQNLSVNCQLAHFTESKINSPRNVSWSPPKPNWNPWRNRHLDKQENACMTLNSLNQKIASLESRKAPNPRMEQKRKQLPIAAYKQQIIDTVTNNRVTLIKGETGCGKSTQVAQYLMESFLEEGRGAEFSAFVSQPRRISAISLAERVALERGEKLGNSVGYGVRFDSVYPRPYGAVFFCTIGVLLRKMESGLHGISHVIIDEIHERDINTDFSLVVLREMSREFPNLRIVLMSATINTALFTHYFGNCPVIEIPGRTFPVQLFFLEDALRIMEFIPEETANKRYDHGDYNNYTNLNILPSNEDHPEWLQLAMSRISEDEIPVAVIEKILLAIVEGVQDGAILIFLPGWFEITQVFTHLTSHIPFSDPNRFKILPLHSQLSGAEQRRVFDHFGEGVRKIILATNIAESSITIDDVVFVIDSCRSREQSYSTTNNMVHFATVWASKSNIKQRCGRAGRVRPGYAFLLCTEILRIPLTTVALTVKLLNLGSVAHFLAKAIEPPSVDMIVEAEIILQQMGALDRNLELTPLGRVLARLPIEPIMGKTIILAASFGIGYLMCQLAAASSFSTPFASREGVTSINGRLNAAQKSLVGSRWSDHTALIAVNQRFTEASQGGFSDEQAFCKRYSLNHSVLKMSRGARQQLLDTLSAIGVPQDFLAPKFVDIHGKDSNLDLMTSLMVSAYYPNVGIYKGKRKIITLERANALASKMSVINDATNLDTPLIVFSEKVRTSYIQCKDITVLNPLQFLLFGSRKVECVGPGEVQLDNMAILLMDPKLAAAIVALRPCIEAHLINTVLDPESLSTMSELNRDFLADRELEEILRILSSPSLSADDDVSNYLPAKKYFKIEEGRYPQVESHDPIGFNRNPPPKRGDYDFGFKSMFTPIGGGDFHSAISGFCPNSSQIPSEGNHNRSSRFANGQKF